MKIREVLSYDDVLLEPKESNILSRSEVNLESFLGPDLDFYLPIISSPMDTVSEASMCIAMADMGALGVVHRYNTIEDQVAIIQEVAQHFPSVSAACPAAAIGITGDFKMRASALAAAGIKILCLDAAHGHHILMERALKDLKDLLGDKIHLMAGNVATRHAFEDLASWGADSIRVGIGGGSICSTRIQTGHGIPTFQSILDCFKADVKRDVKIIADGGMRTSGDIVKALAAGADFVMLGSMLAGTDQAPGEMYTNINGVNVKTYRGMASQEAQHDWRGKIGSNEGISTFIPHKGSVYPILEELKRGIRSGLSYSGCRTLLEFQGAASFVKQTNAGQRESRTHILERA